MRRRTKRRLWLMVIVLAIGAAVAWAVWPKGTPEPGEGRAPGDQESAGGRGPVPSGLVDQEHPDGDQDRQKPVGEEASSVPEPEKQARRACREAARLIEAGRLDPAARRLAPHQYAPKVSEETRQKVGRLAEQLDARRANPASAEEARKLVADGLAHHDAGKVLQARTELSAAYLSGELPAKQCDQIRPVLTDIAAQTLLSPKAWDGDPYTDYYVIESGETLTQIERKLGLKVPWEVLKRINRIENTRKIRAGTRIKILRGPFHAVVDKGEFAMDLYAHRPGLGRAFVKRVPVGLGEHGSTPAGSWRVARGKKLRRQPWHPPPSSPHDETILWGHPDYPLGKDGLWIGLKGTGKQTRSLSGYGIHGTSDPGSVGKAESLGCIRLRDEDIRLVFGLLYEVRSTVTVRQ